RPAPASALLLARGGNLKRVRTGSRQGNGGRYALWGHVLVLDLFQRPARLLWSSQTPAATLGERLLDDARQLGKLERLVQVGIGSIQRRCQLIESVTDPRQHDYARVRERHGLTDATTHFPPAHARHHDIQNYQI